MNEPGHAPFLRRRLGAKLRRLREQAGLTLDEAAPRLDKKRTSLHRVETGQTKADVHLVRSIMDLYNCYVPGLLDETREAFKPPWYRAYGLTNMRYLDVETEAAQVREFALVDIPGLLQTEAYMRAQFAGTIPRTDEAMNRDVAVRLIRQHRLTDPDRPLSLIAVVHELTLHRVLGGPDVMRGQLHHLIDMAKLSSVTLQVIPLSQGATDVPNAPFFLFTFPDPEDGEVLHVEHPAGSLQIEDPAEVQAARLWFEKARTAALSPAGSVALIKRLADRLYGSEK